MKLLTNDGTRLISVPVDFSLVIAQL